MKKILRNTGWLVMAAALVLGMTACSSENDLAEEPTLQPSQTAQTVHVTVGAGIDDGTTRAMVDQDGTTRTLKFTAGDKLFVWGQKHIEEGDYMYDIQGQLAIGTIGTDGTTAEFSGDLTVSKWNESAPDLDLSSLEGLFATLIPAGSTCIKVETNPDNGREELIHQLDGIATGALNTLMATNTEVRGTFADASNVTLKARTAFLNCTVTGLEASTAYDVSLNKGDKVSITTDGSGNLHFLAWFYLNNESDQGVPYNDIHDLRFLIGTNKRVSLGSKTLYAKVYNVTRAAETYTPFTVTDNSTGNLVEPENGMFYSFKEGNADITVSGENEGQTITLWGSSDRVVMSGVTATCGDAIINEENSEGTLNVVLNGANSITITDPMTGGQAIHSNGYLYLSGNGTLTVTVTATDSYGLWGRNYQPSDNSNDEASNLAAMGYTVTRSDMTDNGDNIYTWTYTVAPNPLLAGEFSVSSTKKVQFSKGNLQATYDGTNWTWAFATNQWDYIGNAAGNTKVTATTPFVDYSGSPITVDLFGWVGASSAWNDVNKYGITSSTSTESTDGYGNSVTEGLKSDWGNTIGTGWRTLTKDEWEWLLGPSASPTPGTNCRTSSTLNGVANARFAKAKLFDTTYGLIIFPDSYTHPGGVAFPVGINDIGNTSWNDNAYTTDSWAKMEAAGAVFLPAAGKRAGSSVYFSSSDYWSSSPDASSAYSAYYVYISEGDLSPQDYGGRYYGRSVRLVKEVQP